MIKITTTEQLAGVKLVGDFEDLYQLVDAIHEIVVDEYSEKYEKYSRYANASLRVLGVCYDIRHAYQGDREVLLESNGMTREMMTFHKLIVPENNVYYACNIILPEMIFVTLALNELIELRVAELSKSKYTKCEGFHKNVIWDEVIITLRAFQSAFSKSLKEVMTSATYSRWLNLMSNTDGISTFYTQYLDEMNIDYLDIDREKRISQINKITKAITRHWEDQKHKNLRMKIDAFARENNCDKNDVIFEMAYPETIQW